jgi:hypothetical protein
MIGLDLKMDISRLMMELMKIDMGEKKFISRRKR